MVYDRMRRGVLDVGWVQDRALGMKGIHCCIGEKCMYVYSRAPILVTRIQRSSSIILPHRLRTTPNTSPPHPRHSLMKQHRQLIPNSSSMASTPRSSNISAFQTQISPLAGPKPLRVFEKVTPSDLSSGSCKLCVWQATLHTWNTAAIHSRDNDNSPPLSL